VAAKATFASERSQARVLCGSELKCSASAARPIQQHMVPALTLHVRWKIIARLIAWEIIGQKVSQAEED
jgi:hypothetical protein